jgi:predicted transcriptional regulator of viral defense system
VILLLNYLSKISERILAKRLGYLAETTNLLYNFQIDRRFKKSTINTGLLLANKVQENYLKGYKISVLFLDIKEAFDYISKN